MIPEFIVRNVGTVAWKFHLRRWVDVREYEHLAELLSILKSAEISNTEDKSM